MTRGLDIVCIIHKFPHLTTNRKGSQKTSEVGQRGHLRSEEQ